MPSLDVNCLLERMPSIDLNCLIERMPSLDLNCLIERMPSIDLNCLIDGLRSYVDACLPEEVRSAAGLKELLRACLAGAKSHVTSESAGLLRRWSIACPFDRCLFDVGVLVAAGLVVLPLSTETERVPVTRRKRRVADGRLRAANWFCTKLAGLFEKKRVDVKRMEIEANKALQILTALSKVNVPKVRNQPWRARFLCGKAEVESHLYDRVIYLSHREMLYDEDTLACVMASKMANDILEPKLEALDRGRIFFLFYVAGASLAVNLPRPILACLGFASLLATRLHRCRNRKEFYLFGLGLASLGFVPKGNLDYFFLIQFYILYRAIVKIPTLRRLVYESDEIALNIADKAGFDIKFFGSLLKIQHRAWSILNIRDQDLLDENGNEPEFGPRESFDYFLKTVTFNKDVKIYNHLFDPYPDGMSRIQRIEQVTKKLKKIRADKMEAIHE